MNESSLCNFHLLLRVNVYWCSPLIGRFCTACSIEQRVRTGTPSRVCCARYSQQGAYNMEGSHVDVFFFFFFKNYKKRIFPFERRSIFWRFHCGNIPFLVHPQRYSAVHCYLLHPRVSKPNKVNSPSVLAGRCRVPQ